MPCIRGSKRAAPTSAVRWPASTFISTSSAPRAREAAQRAGIAPPCLNPFKSILVRAVETAYALEEAIALIEAYDGIGEPFVTGAASAFDRLWGQRSAPRDALPSLPMDESGLIRDAKIVPPTSQNLARSKTT